MSRIIHASAEAEDWPIAGEFRIARGAKSVAEVVRVVLTTEDGLTGQGECTPYRRYGESVASVCAALDGALAALRAGATAGDCLAALPPGAARNGLDCALWDLEAKQTQTPVWSLAGLSAPTPVVTAYTLSIDTPEAMAMAAIRAELYPMLKLKLAGDRLDFARLAAICAARPDAQLILDANEGFDLSGFAELLSHPAIEQTVLIEQPLPQGKDAALAGLPAAVRARLCADESVHVTADLDRLAPLYGAVNVKLDKAGGFTEALALVRAAKMRKMTVMVGCMVATSLAMAPAALLASLADVVDLDGPLLLARDREPGFAFNGGLMHPAPPGLWGDVA